MSDSLSVLEVLNQQNKQLCTLENLLKNEYEILQQHDPEKLMSINQLKNTLLTQIAATDELLASDAKFIDDKKNGLYSSELKSIENILLQCKDLNQINGDIIHKSQISIERMRTTLLENHTKSTLTYDNKGKTSGGLTSLNIKA